MRLSTSCCRDTAGRPLPDTTADRSRFVEVPWERLAGWVERYDARHPETGWSVCDGTVEATSPDGGRVTLDVPFASAELTSLDAVFRHLAYPWRLGIVLVRRGGFAVARVTGAETVESKIGRRHVQGKTKAGGWSQHRFANRRDNQAKAAFDAAAEHAARLLLPHAAGLALVGTGGDRQALSAVLEHPRLRPLASRPQRWLGGFGDPNRDVLAKAVLAARSVTVHLQDLDPDLDR